MRDLGVLWNNCHDGTINLSEWNYERRLIIHPFTIYEDSILDLTYDNGLIYDHFSVGNCLSSEIKIKLIPKVGQVIKRDQLIKLEIRVKTINDGTTDWLPFGSYYVTKAEEDSGRWVIQGLDKMKDLDIPYANNIYGSLTWPASSLEVANNIANHFGLPLDERSVLDESILANKPDNITARQALGYLGELHAGNWTVTENNKLRLVVPNLGIPDNLVNEGNSKKIIEDNVVKIDKLIVRKTLNENDFLQVGTGSNEMEYLNPWITQYSINKMYDVLSNYTYKPWRISSTEVNPASELGDTLSIKGDLVNLWQVNYTNRMYANLDFPNGKMPKKNFNLVGNVDNTEQEIIELDERFTALEIEAGVNECIILRDEDFGRYANTDLFYYIDGKIYEHYSEICVILPKDISGIELNSFRSMFKQYKIPIGTGLTLRVISTNEHILDMTTMFENPIAGVYNLDLSLLKTTGVTTMAGMFRGGEFRTLNVLNFDTSEVTDMQQMFRNCVNRFFIELDLSSFNTSNVNNMSYMFNRATGLVNINLSSFNTSNVINMRNMFDQAQNLNSLNLSSFNTSKVTNMAYMFYLCWNLKTIDMSNFNTSEVTDMNQMFRECRSLTALDISHFNTSKVTDMSYMFRDLSVPKLDLSTWVIRPGCYMAFMFANTSVGEIHLPSLPKYPDKVPILQGLFTGVKAGTTTVYCHSTDYSTYKYYDPNDLITFINY